MKISTAASLGLSSLVVIGSVYAFLIACFSAFDTQKYTTLVEGENTIVATKPTSFLIVREDEVVPNEKLWLPNYGDTSLKMDFVVKPSMSLTAKPVSLRVLRTPTFCRSVQCRYTIYAAFFLEKDHVASFRIENRPPFSGKNRRLLIVGLGDSLPYRGMSVLQATRHVKRGQPFQKDDCKYVELYPYFSPRDKDLPLPLLPSTYTLNGLKANRDIAKGQTVNSGAIVLPSSELELLDFLARSRLEFDTIILNGKSSSEVGARLLAECGIKETARTFIEKEKARLLNTPGSLKTLEKSL